MIQQATLQGSVSLSREESHDRQQCACPDFPVQVHVQVNTRLSYYPNPAESVGQTAVFQYNSRRTHLLTEEF